MAIFKTDFQPYSTQFILSLPARSGQFSLQPEDAGTPTFLILC